ncbi:phosphatidate cytidylyltransferase [Flavobacterium sp.]|uniref:phosphatidate cytidylyltransferase n=1 Tax=Flavobacterium sp. TaxID=239 RepID=UPI00286E81A5|nr:phosphatidate cytidylyltransferase [Flavobacterium sp.]
MNETITRSLSGFIYISLLVSATLFSKESFLLLFGLFLLQSISEFCNLIQLEKIPALILAGFLYLIFSFLLPNDLFIDTGLIIISIIILIQLMIWLFKNTSTPSSKISKWILLIGYVILPFIFIVKIPSEHHFEPILIICIFILIWTNDTFAYIVGKSIGKNKLFESISPKKTIEGFVGGLLFSIIAGIIIAYYSFLKTTSFWILTALFVSVFGTIGDLVESKFKRIANVKDSGFIMPGHGGVLDRLDSIIFVAPFLFLLHKIIAYVS